VMQVDQPVTMKGIGGKQLDPDRVLPRWVFLHVREQSSKA
jgi:hypothetical protein